MADLTIGHPAFPANPKSANFSSQIERNLLILRKKVDQLMRESGDGNANLADVQVRSERLFETLMRMGYSAEEARDFALDRAIRRLVGSDEYPAVAKRYIGTAQNITGGHWL